MGTWSRPGAPLAAPRQGPILQGSSHKKRHPKQQYLSRSPLNPSFPISCLTSAKKAVAVTRSLTEQECSHGKRFFTRQGETSPAWSRTLHRGHKRGTHSYPGRPQAGLQNSLAPMQTLFFSSGRLPRHAGRVPAAISLGTALQELARCIPGALTCSGDTPPPGEPGGPPGEPTLPDA